MENTNYIRQAIREAQLNFPLTNTHPVNYFNHLFFTNGNGVLFVDGNPAIYLIKPNRSIPYTSFFNSSNTWEDMLEVYFDRFAEKDIEIEFSFLKENNFLNELDHILFLEAKNSINTQFDELVLIDSISDEELFSDTFWIKSLKKDSKYFKYLHLSNNLFKICEFNENTEINLLKIAIAISKAYISIFKEYLSNNELYLSKESPIGNDFDFEKIFKSDIEILEFQLNRMNSFVSIYREPIVIDQDIQKYIKYGTKKRR
jgi:hypothetical protein